MTVHLVNPMHNVFMPDTALMIDLETLGTAEDAIIASIGAVIFDPRGRDTENTLTNTKYIRINPVSCQAAGMTLDAKTVLWWFEQDQQARDEITREDQVNFFTAMSDFTIWLNQQRPKPARIWAKGYDFDVVKMRNAMLRAGQHWLFAQEYASSRCVRTIMEMADPTGTLPSIGVGVAHHALDDAKRQVLAVQRAYRLLSC
jgi:hypothetical protein